jgi:hypothetical protein
VTDKAIFDQAKNGTFNGFSVEGVFNLIEKNPTQEEEIMGQVFDLLSDLFATIKR